MEEMFDSSPSNADPNVDSLQFYVDNNAYGEAVNADLPLPESIYFDDGIGTSGGIHGGNGPNFGTIGQGSGSCPLVPDFSDLRFMATDQICGPGATRQEIGGIIDEPNEFGTTDNMHILDQICGPDANRQEIGGIIEEPNEFGTPDGSLRSHCFQPNFITMGQSSGSGYVPYSSYLGFFPMGQSSGSGANHQEISGIINGANEVANTTNIGPRHDSTEETEQGTEVSAASVLPHDLEQNDRQKRCAKLLSVEKIAEMVERRRALNREAAQRSRQKKEQDLKDLKHRADQSENKFGEACSVIRNLSRMATDPIETLRHALKLAGLWVETVDK